MAWMMKQGFRIDPDQWASYNKGDIAGDGNGKVQAANVAPAMYEPAPDNRYPAYAALMSDGRLVTDYRSKCEKNVPVGKQFATHQFLVHNAESLIAESRRRQALWNGAVLGWQRPSHVLLLSSGATQTVVQLSPQGTSLVSVWNALSLCLNYLGHSRSNLQ